MKDLEALAHEIVDIVDGFIDVAPGDDIHQVDYYHAIEAVKAKLEEDE